MKRYYSEAEIKALLKKMVIIADSREQVNRHVTEYLDEKKVPYSTRKLDTGDYSAMIEEMTLERDVVIERKACLDELAGNLTADRQRFEAEFTRAKAEGLKVFLLVEGATWSDILMHNYISKLKPQSLLASLFAWQVRYNVTIIFCKPAETAQIIHGILYYAARETLKGHRII